MLAVHWAFLNTESIYEKVDAVDLKEGDVEEAVDHADTNHQGPLRTPQVLDTRALLHPQNLQAGSETCRRLKVEIFLIT